MKLKSIGITIAVLAWVGMLAACSESSTNAFGNCTSSTDCDIGYRCDSYSGRCVPAGCDPACTDGTYCYNGQCLALSDVECTDSADCPAGYSCDTESKACVEDANATECGANKTCSEGYECVEGPDGSSKCVPASTHGDQDEPVATCDPPCSDAMMCCDNQCVSKYPDCVSGINCFEGQTCGEELVCTGEPTSCEKQLDPAADVDLPADEDTPPADEDQNPADEDENPPADRDDAVTPDREDNPVSCTSDRNCEDGTHCGPDRVCVADCTSNTGCPEGAACNPNNGRCEYCNTPCPSGQCCNWNVDFWYCGSCCEPPCADGKACQGGNCVDLRCDSSCDTLCYDCGASTAYICVRKENYDSIPGCGAPDGDYDQERSRTSCLPANSSCVVGVDECCSGTCLMGTCL